MLLDCIEGLLVCDTSLWLDDFFNYVFRLADFSFLVDDFNAVKLAFC